MPDYAAMYRRLFQSQTKAIRLQEEATAILIKAQQDTEEMYISAPEPHIVMLGKQEQVHMPEDEQLDTEKGEDT